MVVSWLFLSFIFFLFFFIIWLLITNNYHYVLEPFKWQKYKLYHKLKFYPYMFGVNTRFYSIVTFRFWGLLLLLVKHLVFLKNLNCFTFFWNIFDLILNFFIDIFLHTQDYIFELIILKDSFLEDRVYFWLEFIDIITTWNSWFSHFPELSFKEFYDISLNYKHTALFIFFYPYLRVRKIYFNLIIIIKIVASSRRRRFKAY